MRWLTSHLRAERGASAVIFGLLLVPLMGFLAISVDVGALYWEKAQLQNGADAAALAIARCEADSSPANGDCALTPAQIASNYAEANALDGYATALIPTFGVSPQGLPMVTVTVHTQVEDGSGAVRHPFAQFLGIDATTVGAEASAEWGPVGSGSFPLAISYCEYLNHDDSGPDDIAFVRNDNNQPCSGTFGQPIAGGFGWLDLASRDACAAIIDLDEATMPSNPGENIENVCKDELERLKGTVVPIPIYNCNEGPCSNGENGQHGEFTIWGFAGFFITGWDFPGSVDRDPDAPSCNGGSGGNGGGNGNRGGNSGGGNGQNCTGLQGYFTDLVEIGDHEIDPDAPDLGVNAVRLLIPDND